MKIGLNITQRVTIDPLFAVLELRAAYIFAHDQLLNR